MDKAMVFMEDVPDILTGKTCPWRISFCTSSVPVPTSSATEWAERQARQRILAMLAERGIITQRELQDMLGVQSGSLSEILNKVETCGYIMRRQK